MLFDKLAGIVERQLPQYQKAVDNARLFRIADKQPSSHESSPVDNKMIDGYDEESALIQNFGLPFNTIAIESADSRYSNGDLVIVFDTIDKDHRIYSVLGMTKIGSEFKIFRAEIDVFNTLKVDGVLTGASMYKRGINIRKLQLWTGDKEQINSESIVVVPWDHKEPPCDTLPAFEAANAAEKLVILDQHRSRLMGQFVRLNLATAVLYVVSINSPSHFVVEESPMEGLRKSKKGIRRSCDRPHYIIMTPNTIRTKFISLPTNTGRTVTAHERRAHYRELRSERFTNARGKIIRVEAVWVGPSETVVGKNRYKVMLDL